MRTGEQSSLLGVRELRLSIPFRAQTPSPQKISERSDRGPAPVQVALVVASIQTNGTAVEVAAKLGLAAHLSNELRHGRTCGSGNSHSLKMLSQQAFADSGNTASRPFANLRKCDCDTLQTVRTVRSLGCRH